MKSLFGTSLQTSILAILAMALPLGISSQAHASTLSEDVLGELAAMKAIYRTEYAPGAWKKHYSGYDLNTEYAKAVAAVQSKSPLTLKDSRTILKNFIYAMKDYHTSISFVSTETATLPLSIKGAGDRFL